MVFRVEYFMIWMHKMCVSDRGLVSYLTVSLFILVLSVGFTFFFVQLSFACSFIRAHLYRFVLHWKRKHPFWNGNEANAIHFVDLHQIWRKLETVVEYWAEYFTEWKWKTIWQTSGIKLEDADVTIQLHILKLNF